MLSEACRISLDQFEGPLDLLLYLVKRDELDIREIALARVAEQYLSYIREAESLDLDIASEYLVMAATLTSIKSRALLPSRTIDDEEDPGAVLMRQLIIYRAFKEVAAELRESEEVWRNAFTPPGERDRWSVETPAAIPGGVGILDLLAALESLAAEDEPAPSQRYEKPTLTIAECMDIVRERLRGGGSASLRDLAGPSFQRRMVVAFFLTLLELARRELVSISQRRPFGEISFRAAGAWA